MKIPKLLLLTLMFLITSSSLTFNHASTEKNLAISVSDGVLQTEIITTDDYSSPTFNEEHLNPCSLTPVFASSYLRDVLINEVGVGQIELYNNVYDPINLTDYYLELYLSNGSTFTIETFETVEVSSGDYYVLNNLNSNMDDSMIIPTGGFLELKSSSITYQDVVAWGHIGIVPTIPVDSSISRVKITEWVFGYNTEWVVVNDWSISSTTTFGATNDVVGPLVDEFPIKISEVYVDSENGFIELVNIGFYQINLGGYQLYYNDTLIHTFSEEISIATNEIAIFEINSLSSIGNLYLYDDDGVRISQMGWDEIIAGRSLNHFFDFTFDYSEIDDCFTYDTEELLNYRKIEAQDYDWYQPYGYDTSTSGFVFSDPSPNNPNVKSIIIEAEPEVEFVTGRNEDIASIEDKENSVSFGLYTVTVTNQGSQEFNDLSIYSYLDAGLNSPDPRISRIPFFNWTNIEHHNIDLAPGETYNYKTIISAQQNGTRTGISFAALNGVVMDDALTTITVERAQADIVILENNYDAFSGEEFNLEFRLMNIGNFYAEDIKTDFHEGENITQLVPIPSPAFDYDLVEELEPTGVISLSITLNDTLDIERQVTLSLKIEYYTKTVGTYHETTFDIVINIEKTSGDDETKNVLSILPLASIFIPLMIISFYRRKKKV